jgi:hypothetical protein
MENAIAARKVFKKPFALFMGPQRAGTSWIDRYLRFRGDVCLPGPVKEVFFFDRHFSRGLDFYRAHFDPEKQHRLISEVTTTAFDHPDAPQRVFETFGTDVRLICPLRHPVTRAFSLYNHYRRYGLVSGTLEEACAQEPQILGSSRYAYHLQRWYAFFPKENIRLLFQEDLEKRQNTYVKALCEALDLPYIEVNEALAGKFNAATLPPLGALAGIAQKGADWLRGRRMYFVINMAKKMGAKELIFGRDNAEDENLKMTPVEKAWLEKNLGAEIEQLEALTGPLPHWGRERMETGMEKRA